MKVILGTNEELSKLIADEFISLIKEKPNAVLGLATGTSPIKIYQNLVKAYQDGVISFRDIKTFNLDEYIRLFANSVLRSEWFFKYDQLQKVVMRE